MESSIRFDGPLAKICYDYVGFRQAIGYQMGYSSQRYLKKIIDVLYLYPSLKMWLTEPVLKKSLL